MPAPKPSPPARTAARRRAGSADDQTEPAAPPALPRRRVDLDVDLVAGPAAESRVAPGGEEDVRVDVRRVADVRGEEVVQDRRHLGLDHHGEPRREPDGPGGDAPERQPDEVGNREQQPEEDGETRPHEVVLAQDEADRTTRLHGRHYPRWLR